MNHLVSMFDFWALTVTRNRALLVFCRLRTAMIRRTPGAPIQSRERRHTEESVPWRSRWSFVLEIAASIPKKEEDAI